MPLDGQDSPELPVKTWLASLGIATLTQWDVLMFIYRHRTSLVGAEFIARLLGYPTDPVVAALESLDGLALVRRSRASQGVRLYQFASPDDPARRDDFNRLISLAQSRTGRLRIYGSLLPRDITPQEKAKASGTFLEEARQTLRSVERRYSAQQEKVKAAHSFLDKAQQYVESPMQLPDKVAAPHSTRKRGQKWRKAI